MSRKKILWLCSWYPGKTEPFNGDFIQRHARAAALYNDIYVIHVIGDESGKIKGREVELREQDYLTEEIIYFQKTSDPWGKLLSQWQWLHLYRKAIRSYIKNHGKPDAVHVQVAMKSGILALWMKKKYSIPYVVTEHWGIYNDVEILNYQGRTQLFKKYTREIFSGASSFISVSRFLAEGVNRMVVSKKYQVIPNVVDTDSFFYKNVDITTPFRFLHVSNMAALKNPEGILRAFKLFSFERRDVELVIVGPANKELQKLAGEILPGGTIKFRGEITYEDVAKEMQQAHCLVLFSDIENSPCVIGEAFCTGIPLIATSVGGIPELVNRSNGLLVDPRNESMLAKAMEEMRDNYGTYDRDKISREARSKFCFPVIGKQHDEVYESITAVKPSVS